MGDMAEHLDDSYDFADEFREQDLQRRDDERNRMADRSHQASRAQTGATIKCANCGRLVVKKTAAQKFCPPVKQGKKKRYVCKDAYHNELNPRGKFAHLADH